VPGEPTRVLVVDDEPLARMRIEDLVAQVDDARMVGTAANGIEAIERIRALRPDVVFLDVQMPGKTGIDVVREIGAGAMPATIFVTAFDQFAVQAFDVAAIDYLVKPFDDERFSTAFARARHHLAMQEMGQLRQHLLAMLAASPDAPMAQRDLEPAAMPYLERIAVEMRGKVRTVPVDEIDFIVASGPYAELHVGEKRHLIREAMQTLEVRLDPGRFMRVHRSMIVRLALVDTLHRGAGGDYEVQLKSGLRIRVSRSRREALERWLGVPG
jgi:two-component system LytT family response regulator